MILHLETTYIYEIVHIDDQTIDERFLLTNILSKVVTNLAIVSFIS